MKRLICALAAAMLVLPAAGETLKTGPVVKDARDMCVSGLKAERFKAAGALCGCYSNKLKRWADAEKGYEQQLKLWTIMADLMPDDTTDEEFYRRVAETGISRNEIDEAIILNFYDVQDFIESCAAPYK